ncbi:MAG TPA: hypothetical protein VEY69_18265, partial [Lautropia sp.]|nr:hypothetical protein [Lautropia sp.]
VAVAEAILGSIAGFFVFVLHVAVLYLTVELGPFHRRFMELQLLIGAGEERSARSALARWVGSAGIHRDRVAPGTGTAHSAADGVAGGSMPASPGAMPRPVAEPAAAHAILAAYRDVFAPLFWYLVLPGAVGPVLYLFARFAACYSYPLARTAYYGLDWIPLRLASLGFALAGRFEDTVYCLRAVSSIRTPPSPTSDVFLHQRLLLLPVAGGALGLRLMDAATDAQLRRQAPDLDLPGFDPEATSLRQVSGLLVRSSFLWAGLYLLVKLLD